MTDVSRRQFLRHASIGAASAGVLAATGGALLSGAEAGASPLPKRTASALTNDVPAGAATDIFAHVSDLSTGQVTVFHGTDAFTITDSHLAHALAKVTQ